MANRRHNRGPKVNQQRDGTRVSDMRTKRPHVRRRRAEAARPRRRDWSTA